MAKVVCFEDLEIWKIAKDVGVKAYSISDIGAFKSDYGLKDQFRRAAMSMSDNVAEGFEYNNNPDFIRFLRYAKGSSGEFRNKLIILRESQKIRDEDFKFLYDKSIEFSAKTKRFIEYLKAFEQQRKTDNK